jgi:hypothetical protein
MNTEITLLAAYDRARTALAEASLVRDVLEIRLQLDHVKLHAKSVQNRAVLIEATVLQLRAERRLGQMLRALQDAGLIAVGRPPKATAEETPRATLEDIGLTYKLSSKAQKCADLSDAEFEAITQATREKLASSRAILVDPIDNSGVIHGARSIMSGRVEPDDSLDYFPTPPCATRALVELVFDHLKVDVRSAKAREPACGEGHIAEVLAEYFAEVSASDIFDYGYGEVSDFLDEHTSETADWFITNPPFGDKAEAFFQRMMELARVGVALFVRLQWLEGEGRYERIFAGNPPTCIAFFAERIALHKGRWEPQGGTATAYVWLVWIKHRGPQAPFWIPPIVVDELTDAEDAARFTTHPVTRRAA